MKKHLFILMVAAVTVTKAQFVNIPDANFRNWLNTHGYASCMNGNLMDTTCSAVVNETMVTCQNSNINSLDGLQYFDNLRHLTCYSNNLSDLSFHLPNTLQDIYCSGNHITQIGNLPSSLLDFRCEYNQLSSLPALPSSLQLLSCSNNQITLLPSLPSSLSFLICDHNQLTTLPTLPNSLGAFYCSHNQLSSLPEFPDSLSNCSVSNNPFLICLPELKQITYFDFTNTGITCLPNYGNITNSTPSLSTLPLCTPPAATITPAGAVTFCSGGSVTLNANAGVGFTYKWIKNGITIIGSTSQSYTAIASGNYSVEVTKNCGIAVSSAVTVTVNSLPSAAITTAGPTTFCSGSIVILNAPTGTNKTYQWKKGTNIISGATLSSYTANTGGNYRVIVTNTLTGCSKTTGSATVVTVNALPAATITPQGPTTFCAGGSVVLVANSGVGLTYKWKKGSNYISGATLSNYTATTGGNYRVQITNSNSCSKVSGVVAVSVPCKEGESVNAGEGESVFDVNVYPNPNSGEFTIKFSAKPSSPVQIELTDEIGKVVRRFETNDETVVIKESNLAKGFYYLNVQSKEIIFFMKKIIVI